MGQIESYKFDQNKPDPLIFLPTTAPNGTVCQVAVGQDAKSNTYNKGKAKAAGLLWKEVPQGWNNFHVGTYFFLSDGKNYEWIKFDDQRMIPVLTSVEQWNVKDIDAFVPKQQAINWYEKHGWPKGSREMAIFGYQWNRYAAIKTGKQPKTRLVKPDE